VLTNNLVFSTCRESGDHGPFNSWDRQPYLTTVATGQPSVVMAWRTISYNFFIDNYSPQEGIDNDDGSNNYHSHHNFLVYGNNGMKNDFGGHDNHHSQNLYAYTSQMLFQVATLRGHEGYSYENKAVLTGGNVGYVQCSGVQTIMYRNQYFTPSGTIGLCGHPLAQAQNLTGMDTNSTVMKWPAPEVVLGGARGLLSMPAREVEGRSGDFIVFA